ncbi:hypothetical protein V1512DRAFT_269192 [Lipomyces arxii]|uniref:uncharacterized protein n=1 Tax=Lipomyces arxii TaxID=56418 RepID=UPI0034CE4AF5
MRSTQSLYADEIALIPKELLVATDAEKVLKDDSEFTKFSWDNLKNIIANNQLELLSRTPSDLRKYLRWKGGIVKDYQSIANYVLTERLKWGPDPTLAKAKGTKLFELKDDYKILLNDFPYGFEDGIVHVVVWTKIAIPKAELGDVSSEGREALQTFSDTKFRAQLNMSPDQVLWFKNWAALQSIPEVDHFHVLLNKPPASGQGVAKLLELLSEDVDVEAKLAAVDSRFRIE